MKRLPKEYLDDILVRFAHHSCAIEGNTITLAETISIILHNQVISNRSLKLREIYEIKNHEQAFHYMLDRLSDNDALHLVTLKDIHGLLLDRLHHENGQFKSVDYFTLKASPSCSFEHHRFAVRASVIFC